MQTTNKCFGLALFCVAATSGCTEQVGGTQPNYDGHKSEAAESESEGEGVVTCEEVVYTQEQVDTARDSVFAVREDNGTPVEPIVWEDEEGYRELAQAIVDELGCTPQEEADTENATRRNGPASCEIVNDLMDYDETALYCGVGARRGTGCGFPWWNPGDCMNRVCHQHDLCYDDLVTSRGSVCIWNSDTSSCDNTFHVDGVGCALRTPRGRQMFWYLIVNSIATGLDALEAKARLRGLRCLLGDIDCDEGGQQSCGASDVGACMRGTQTCQSGQWGVCVGAVGSSPEICDELDNDCDGAVDDLGTTTCGVGVCLHIIDNCEDGLTQTCDPMEGVTTETCNADLLDEDCNGSVNEGCACTNGTMRSCGTTDLGVCETGIQTCASGSWGSCVGEVVPVAEICDGLDNDCDDEVDEEPEAFASCADAISCTAESCVDGACHITSDDSGCGPDFRCDVSGGCVLKGKLAFARDTNLDRWDTTPDLVVRADIASSGSETTLAYMGTQNVGGLSWSPDGLELVYSYAMYQIYRINADGTNNALLIDAPGEIDRYPDWSPDGTTIVFTRWGSPYLLFYDLASGAETDPEVAGIYHWNPRWSPDGTLIVFNRGCCEFCTVESDGGNLLCVSPGFRVHRPRLLADGRVIYHHYDEVTFERGIGIMESDGSGSELIVDCPLNDCSDPDPSPEGSGFVYVRGGDLHVALLDGTDDIQLTETEEEESYPDWTP